MLNSKEFEERHRRNTEQRRAMIKRWAAFVKTNDDVAWSRQQNTLIDAQLQSANEQAAAGETDPVEFFAKRDRLRRR